MAFGDFEVCCNGLKTKWINMDPAEKKFVTYFSKHKVDNSNINEGIKAVLFFIFFTKRFHTHKKDKKHKKYKKHKTQINNFHSDVFYSHKKAQRVQTAQTQTSDFPPFRCFLCT